MVRGMNNPGYDERGMHYGFTLALNYSTFEVRRSKYFSNQITDTTLWDTLIGKPLYGVRPVGNLGLTVGFIMNLGTTSIPWLRNWNLRILPSVSFYNRILEYRFSDDSLVPQLNQSLYSFIEIPILIKYKSKRRNNVRMYFLGGVTPAFEVGSRRDELDPRRNVRLGTSDFSLTYGVGIEMFYPYFNFAPEIRFSHGVQNIISRDPNIYSRSVSRILTHTITFVFNFEG